MTQTPERKSQWSWDSAVRALEVLAGVAALGSWIVLIGAIRVYERLENAHVPAPTRTVAGLPKEQLLAEGIRELAVSVLVAVLAATTAALVLGTRRDAGTAGVPPTLRGAVMGLLLAGAVGYAVVAQWGERRLGFWLWIVSMVIAVSLLGGLAMRRARSPLAVALVAAAIVLVWGGTAGVLTERYARHASFEPMQILRKDGTGLRGYLLSRSDSSVTVLCVGSPHSLLVLQREDIQQISYQPAVSINQDSADSDCRDDTTDEARPPVATTTTSTHDYGPLRVLTVTTTRTVREPSRTITATVTDPTPSPSPSPPPDTEGPALRLTKTSARARADGRYLIHLPRFDERVTGVASVLADRPSHGRLRVATKAFQAGPANRATIVVGMSPAATSLFRAGALRARLVVTVRDALGNATTKFASLQLTRRP